VSDRSSHRSVAIVEITGVHEEVIPSLVDALPEGTKVEIFVNERCRAVRGDLFHELKGLNAKVIYVDIVTAGDWTALGERIDAGGHDALIISTLQIDGVAKWARARTLPVIGVVHNPVLFQRADDCKAWLAEDALGVIVLAPHVQARFNAMTQGSMIDKFGVIEPVFWGDDTQAQPNADSPRKVIVPGGVNFAARDFRGLVEALDPARARRLRERRIELQIIGGGADRAALEVMLSERNLSDVVTLLELAPTGRVPYAAYIAALREAWAIYPLLPLTWPPYREYKITSAIPTAIGFALPVVLDRWTNGVYRVPALVTDAAISAALDGLVDLEDADRTNLIQEIESYFDAARLRNQNEMAWLMRN